MPDFDEAKKRFKMADSKKLRFTKPTILNNFLPKFQGLVLGFTKGMDVAQLIWLSGFPK